MMADVIQFPTFVQVMFGCDEHNKKKYNGAK